MMDNFIKAIEEAEYGIEVFLDASMWLVTVHHDILLSTLHHIGHEVFYLDVIVSSVRRVASSS